MSTQLHRDRERMSLGHFFAQQAAAEHLILDRLSLVSCAYAAIGCVEITSRADIERTLQTISPLKAAINAACALPEQRAVPESVWVGDWAYREAWKEPLALLEDAVLFLSAYQDVLETDERQDRAACLERQLNLRTHHVYLILSVHASLEKATQWRRKVREDEDGEGEEEEVEA